MALRQRGLAGEVVGCGRDLAKLKKAADLGAIDRCELDLTKAVKGAQVVLACTPVQQIPVDAQRALPLLAEEGWMTDVGSTKSTILQSLAHHEKADRFVGSHPMAGSDKSGVQHARADLLEGRTVLVTPTSQNPPELVQQVEAFWRSLGAIPRCMSPQGHDQAVALVSHLPHLLSAALAASTPRELLELVATGWASTTRLAAGNPELWRQIVQENKAPVLRALENFATIWQSWIEAVRSDDPTSLKNLLEAGKQIRDLVGSRHSSG
jgi:prephenate dehydrogenase